MYLNKAPAGSGRATLRCGISWRSSATGGCIFSFSSSSLFWEIGMAKFTGTFFVKLSKKFNTKRWLLHFLFICFFSKNVQNSFNSIYDLFYNPKWWPFLWFFSCQHKYWYLSILGGPILKLHFMKGVAFNIWLPD